MENQHQNDKTPKYLNSLKIIRGWHSVSEYFTQNALSFMIKNVRWINLIECISYQNNIDVQKITITVYNCHNNTYVYEFSWRGNYVLNTFKYMVKSSGPAKSVLTHIVLENYLGNEAGKLFRKHLFIFSKQPNFTKDINTNIDRMCSMLCISFLLTLHLN